MCLLTSARTVAIVLARSAGSEAMYCAGVLMFAAGFMDSSSFPNEVYQQTLVEWGKAISTACDKEIARGRRNTYHGDTEALRRREIQSWKIAGVHGLPPLRPSRLSRFIKLQHERTTHTGRLA